jgi:predicted phage terminase large subunit-like protein
MLKANIIHQQAAFEQQQQRLVDSLLHFTQVFYLIRTGRKFELSSPPGRESHYITICRALERVFDGKCKRLIINVPPRYAKTELLIHCVAWSLAQYPDSNYIYTSYAHSLAKKQTQTIRSILTMKEYQDYFDVHIKGDTSAKDNFETMQGGSVYAAGAGGSITGRGAGIKGANRFGGFIAIDDIHKPDEASSDTIREGINDWYYNTLQSRVNSPTTPIIFIGQRLHEDDLAARLIKTGEWETVIIPAIDAAGNPLHPEMHDLPTLRKMQETSPYIFAAQYQQDPQPAGGGIFKREWFALLDEEPEILATFITADSAETEEEYNDATVFSFWGLYKIKHGDHDTGLYGLHWLDCHEMRIEPKDLESQFVAFYHGCLRHRVPPTIAAIEKKSTGVTLLSNLKKYRGLRIYEIVRDRTSGSKVERFLEAQPYVASHQISLPIHGKHTQMCIEHCRKITANNSHRFDDIADTMYDAINLGLITKTIINMTKRPDNDSPTAKNMMSTFNKIDRLKRDAYT